MRAHTLSTTLDAFGTVFQISRSCDSYRSSSLHKSELILLEALLK